MEKCTRNVCPLFLGTIPRNHRDTFFSISEKQWNVREEDLDLPIFLFLKVLPVDTAWRRKKTGKFMSMSPNMSLKLCTERMQPWEGILFFPIQATYTHLQKRVGRSWCRRLVLSLHPACISSISGHWEGKFWPISNCICLGKGHLLWGAVRAPPHSCRNTANPSYERHKAVRKIVCRNPSRKEQICATDGLSLLAEWFGGEKRNNGLVFGGLRSLPCLYHNGSLNLPSQMGTGCAILQSGSR